MHCVNINKVFLTIFRLVVTLTDDLLTSKSNQFIPVPICTEAVGLHLVKFSQAIHKVSCQTNFQ